MTSPALSNSPTSTSAARDKILNKNRLNPSIIDPNKYTTRIDTELNRLAKIPSSTLGVEQELRRFAMNEYLNEILELS